MRCIFDENLPIKLARTLNYLEGDHGIEVKHMTEIVSPSTSDEEWIKLLGKEDNCFVITKDNKIKINRAELEAWKEANLTIVFLQDSWFHLDFWIICWKFIKVWPSLKESLKKERSRKTILVHIQGKVEVLEMDHIAKIA